VRAAGIESIWQGDQLAGRPAGRENSWQGDQLAGRPAGRETSWQGDLLAERSAGRESSWQGEQMAGRTASRENSWQGEQFFGGQEVKFPFILTCQDIRAPRRRVMRLREIPTLQKNLVKIAKKGMPGEGAGRRED
jgi:hypothetical protein